MTEPQTDIDRIKGRIIDNIRRHHANAQPSLPDMSVQEEISSNIEMQDTGVVEETPNHIAAQQLEELAADVATLQSGWDIYHVPLTARRWVLEPVLIYIRRLLRRLLGPVLAHQVSYNLAQTRVVTVLMQRQQELMQRQQELMQRQQELMQRQQELMQRRQELIATLDKIEQQITTSQQREKNIQGEVGWIGQQIMVMQRGEDRTKADLAHLRDKTTELQSQLVQLAPALKHNPPGA